MATTSDETGVGIGIVGVGGVPGDFCHDNYEHPLLWCDEKKRLVERKNAEESMRMWRRRKAEEMARKDKEKQEYYELFVQHCPWGRPGGGAPNLDVRRKDITAIGLHSTETLGPVHRLTSHQSCPRFSDYFTQQHKKCFEPVTAHHHAHHHHAHHHVPRITTHAHTVHHHLSDSKRPVAGSTVTICEREISGPMRKTLGGGGGGAGTTLPNGKIGETLEITLKDHPSMSFRNKGHVDIEVRYKPTAPGKGKPILEKIVVTESDKCPAVPPVVIHGKAANAIAKSPMKKKLHDKMEKPLCKDPWGKSGPGGKPWRDPKAVGSTLMKSLGWTNKELLKDLDQDNPATPAEKHTFRKVRASKKPQLMRCCDLCTCSCPALLNSGGGGGGGARGGVGCGPGVSVGGGFGSPLKPIQKRVTQQNHSPPKMEMPVHCDMGKQKICSRLLRRAANHQQTTTDNSTTMTATGAASAATVENNGGVELVPLLARRRAKNRPISLSSTDVTKRTASHDRIPTAADLRYLHDLNEQISVKRRSISAAQQCERDLCNQHFETFDTFWGRPGHGAPSEIKQKLKLDNLLYGDQGQGLE